MTDELDIYEEDDDEEDGFTPFAEPWEVLDYIRERIGWTQSYRYYGIAQIKDEVRVGDELDAADVLICRRRTRLRLRIRRRDATRHEQVSRRRRHERRTDRFKSCRTAKENLRQVASHCRR